ncbi:hypothetical protein AB0J42_37265 [Nonomuraea sp. NPDC049649]|uniref:hypothetical protein n=1 Tax=Nonomuraea sp. NPDC049649 TaxID=3155776 RepID=UPI0034478A6D
MIPDFHGPHAGVRTADAESIDWHDPLPRFYRVRVLRHTCECRTRVYELCASSGLAWIRRIERTPAGVTVKESHPTSYGKAEELWKKLLSGQAG